MYAIQHRCMSLKVDVSRMKLIYVIFEFLLLHITIIYITKHRCLHVRNFVRKKKPIIRARSARNDKCTFRYGSFLELKSNVLVKVLHVVATKPKPKPKPKPTKRNVSVFLQLMASYSYIKSAALSL